jgi:hypothetical protein
MVFKEIFVVYSENHTKPIKYTLVGRINNCGLLKQVVGPHTVPLGLKWMNYLWSDTILQNCPLTTG